MKKIDIDVVNRWLTAVQSIAVILGVVFAAWQLEELVQQTRLQTETLRQTQEINSANFVLEMTKTLAEPKYDKVATVIQNGNEDTPLVRFKDGGRGGSFSVNDVEDYISNLDDIGLLLQNGLVIPGMAYDDFSYDIETAWCNNDIKHIVERDRANDKSASAKKDPFHAYFTNLAEKYLLRDQISCKNIWNQL